MENRGRWNESYANRGSGLEKYRRLPLDKQPEAALMGLRKGLGVTTNIRPVKYYPQLAGGRRKKVSSLDKSNVLESSRLWRHTIQQTAESYPEILLEHYYIDNAAMRILAEPENFDVIVTSNLFGDIISDEGTQMTGTPYLYGSAELNPEMQGIYTPNQLHHPDESLIGKQAVNPCGMIAAAALMLRYTFQLEDEATLIETAIGQVIESGYGTKDICGTNKIPLSTIEMGNRIIERMEIE